MREESKQLGMNYSTASNRLRKMILLKLLQDAKKDICFRCGNKIKTVAELSIEHKEQWLNINALLFWDLSNIAFSHLICNTKAQRRKPAKHGTLSGYDDRGCRCKLCKEAVKLRRRRQRASWKANGRKRLS